MEDQPRLTATILGTLISDSITFYNIEIVMEGHIVWKIKRRFSQFETLMAHLRKKFKELPPLPEKHYIFKIT